MDHYEVHWLSSKIVYRTNNKTNRLVINQHQQQLRTENVNNLPHPFSFINRAPFFLTFWRWMKRITIWFANVLWLLSWQYRRNFDSGTVLLRYRWLCWVFWDGGNILASPLIECAIFYFVRCKSSLFIFGLIDTFHNNFNCLYRGPLKCSLFYSSLFFIFLVFLLVTERF